MADRPPPVPDPAQTPTLSVEEAGRIIGISRAKAYVEANRWLHTGGAEGIPVIRFGRTLRVPTAQLVRLLNGAPVIREGEDL